MKNLFLTSPALDTGAVKRFLDGLTLGRILGPVAVFLVGLLVIKLLLRLLDQALRKSKLEPAAYGMLRSLTKFLLLFLLLLIVAGQLGIDVTSLIAVLSVVSLAVSLAVQGALTNVVGGMTLLATHPFKAGDFVDIGSQSGVVQEVGVTYTKLQTPDGKLVCIPNGAAANSEITNYTALGLRRVNLTASASYDFDTQTVKQALQRAMAGPGVLTDPEPFVGIERYEAASIVYSVMVWCRAEDYWTVYYSVNEAIRRELEQAGIQMAHPKMNVHLE